MATKPKSNPRKPTKQTRRQPMVKLRRSRRSRLRVAAMAIEATDQDELVAALKTEVDGTGAELARLIAETRQGRIQALQEGDDTNADRLLALSMDYSDQLIQLGKRQLREFDSSEAVINLITQFQEVNATIDQTIKQVEKIKKFIDRATTVAQVLDKLIQAAMKATV